MREREREKQERMSLSTALRWLWEIWQRAKGTAFAPAPTSTGQLRTIRAACLDPHNGATLIPALCMWILDPNLGVDGEWGQQLIWLIGFGVGVTMVGEDVAHMQLIAMSSILMSSDKVVNWGKGTSVDISRERGHCVLKLWGKRVVPRLADIGKMMQQVARSAFCAVSRALAAGLMRPSSAKPTNWFCGGRLGLGLGCSRGLGVVVGAERPAEVKADQQTNTTFTASAGLRVISASVFVADSSLRQRATTSSNLGKLAASCVGLAKQPLPWWAL